MKILAKTKYKFDGSEEYLNRLPPASQVKRLGKYLKDNLLGVYNAIDRPNGYIIYSSIMYQIKPEVRKAMKQYPEELKGIEEEIYFKDIYYSIAAYHSGEYIRLLILEADNNSTLGFLRFDKLDLMSLPDCKRRILEYTKKCIEKRYANYEVEITDEEAYRKKRHRHSRS